VVKLSKNGLGRKLAGNPISIKLKKFVEKHFGLLEMRSAAWKKKNPFRNAPPYSTYPSDFPYTLGIIKEFWHDHWNYVAACRDLRVAYKILDISGPDWLNVIRESGCDVFLVKPSVQLSIWKQMYDERLKIMAEELKVPIFPTHKELWIWESKRRMHDWLKVNSIAHPKTWVFYDRKEAIAFAEEAKLPVVYKSDMGSGASGIKIFRNRTSLRHHISRSFKKGVTTYRRGPMDKEWGFVIFQEYLPDVREWRIIRIGNSFFGYEKLKVGDFHSGAHQSRHGFPPEGILNFAETVTEIGSFLNVGLDIFETRRREYLINEIQTYFGMEFTKEMCVVDSNTGRLIKNSKNGKWVFEPGSYCENRLCNLRIQTLLELLIDKSNHIYA
jgi:hypothetical protein